MTAANATNAIINSGGMPQTPAAINYSYGGGGGCEEPKSQIPPQLPPEDFPPLPALRCLGKLNGVRPVIVIDTREKLPLPFQRLAWERATLQTGDYSYAGAQQVFGIERKAIGDLVSCCMGPNRERFERELHRLRGFHFARLLIVGTPEEVLAGQYVSRIPPKAVLASLMALEMRYSVPVIWEPTQEAAGRRIEAFCYWHARQAVEAVNELARAAGLTRRSPAGPAQSIPKP